MVYRVEQLYFNITDTAYAGGASTSNPDNSAAVNAAIAAAVAAGGGVLWVPAGVWKFTAQVALSPGVSLQGAGYSWNYNSGGVPNGGSWFEIDWGNGTGYNGNITYAAVVLSANSGVDGIGFDYPIQVSTNSSALECGSTIQINGNPNINQHVTNCFFRKSYVAIDFRAHLGGGQGGNTCNISNNQGCPLLVGVYLSFAVDVGVIEKNFFQSGWINPQDVGYSGHLLNWVRANGTAFYILSTTWTQFFQCSDYGYVHGFVLDMSTAGSIGDHETGPFSFDQCAFDGTFAPITCVGNFGGQTVTVSNCTFDAYQNDLYHTAPSTSIGSAVSLASATVSLVFNGNTVGLASSVITATSGTINIIAYGNTAAVGNGAPYGYYAWNVTVGNNCQFINNILVGFNTSGGGVAVQSVNPSNTITHLVATNNQTS